MVYCFWFWWGWLRYTFPKGIQRNPGMYIAHRHGFFGTYRKVSVYHGHLGEWYAQDHTLLTSENVLTDYGMMVTIEIFMLHHLNHILHSSVIHTLV